MNEARLGFAMLLSLLVPRAADLIISRVGGGATPQDGIVLINKAPATVVEPSQWSPGVRFESAALGANGQSETVGFSVEHTPVAWTTRAFPQLTWASLRASQRYPVMRLTGAPSPNLTILGDANDSAGLIGAASRYRGGYGLFHTDDTCEQDPLGCVQLLSWVQKVPAYGAGPSAWWGTVSAHPLILYVGSQAALRITSPETVEVWRAGAWRRVAVE